MIFLISKKKKKRDRIVVVRCQKCEVSNSNKRKEIVRVA